MMRRRAVVAYCILLAIVFLSHVYPSRLTGYLLPVYMTAIPLFLGQGIRFSFSPRHIQAALLVSAIVLVPTYLFLSAHRTFHFMAAPALLSQFMLVALPEEVFFRGFLQQAFGNNYRGIVLVSLLFGAAHIPAFLFYHDAYALLTFFPSLVMGFLYMKTRDLFPPVLFHFLSNAVYRGFMI